MEMFKNQIRFYGKHARIMKQYSKSTSAEAAVPYEVDNNEGKKEDKYIFDTLLQCYMVAGMLGIINKRREKPDSNKTIDATIMADILNKKRNLLIRIYQHMVLTEDSGLSPDARVKKAFTVSMSDEESKQEQDRLEDYVRGGLEIIDEMFGGCLSYEDIARQVYSLKEKLTIEELPAEE